MDVVVEVVEVERVHVDVVGGRGTRSGSCVRGTRFNSFSSLSASSKGVTGSLQEGLLILM
eukprot:2118680-Amphidinium_carterae.1